MPESLQSIEERLVRSFHLSPQTIRNLMNEPYAAQLFEKVSIISYKNAVGTFLIFTDRSRFKSPRCCELVRERWPTRYPFFSHFK